MIDLLFGWVKWLQQSKKACFALVGIGLSIEGLVILLHILIKSFQDSGRYPFGLSSYALFSVNAVIGFFGTIIAVFGVINLIRMLRVSRWATIWGYAACSGIVTYKTLDVAYSFEVLCLEELLGLSFELDTLIMNLLLIGSAGMLATAMVCALFDLNNTEEMLQERNRSLDREIQERRLLSAAIQNAAESIEITNADGTIIYVNPAFEKLMGYTQEEMLGCSWERLKNNQHKEEFYAEIVDSIGKEDVWRGRLVNTQKDGTPITSDAIVSVIRNKDGDIENYIAAKRDVTKEDQLEKQVLQSQKLEAIGTLAGGIAHDLNNVLAVIIGHSEISMGRLEPEHPVRKSLEVIMRTAERSSQLIKRLLLFSRQDVAEPKPIEPALLPEFHFVFIH